MPRTPTRVGELTAAASALEADLDALEAAVAEGGRVHLNTRKGLERLARDVGRAAEVHDRLQQRVGQLATKLHAAQERAVGAATDLLELGAELGRRQAAYTTLLGAYETLVADAVAVRELAGQGPETLGEVQERLTALAERAHALAEDAREAGFRDLQKDASARHQQLQALANRLGAQA